MGKCDLNLNIEFPCLGFSYLFFVGCRKKTDVHEGFGGFDGMVPFNVLAAGIMGLGYKTEPTTPSQIDEVRLSEIKGAHKSKALIIVVILTVSSRECWMGGQPKIGCRFRYFKKSEDFRGLGALASRVPESKTQPRTTL